MLENDPGLSTDIDEPLNRGRGFHSDFGRRCFLASERGKDQEDDDKSRAKIHESIGFTGKNDASLPQTAGIILDPCAFRCCGSIVFR